MEELLERIVELTPPPVGEMEEPLQALVFDSKYDSFKGVVAYVRVMDGADQGSRSGEVHGFGRSGRGFGGRVFLADCDACAGGI